MPVETLAMEADSFFTAQAWNLLAANQGQKIKDSWFKVEQKQLNSTCVEIDHFTVAGLVTSPLNGSEAGVDLVLIQTSLLLLCKSSCSYAN